MCLLRNVVDVTLTNMCPAENNPLLPRMDDCMLWEHFLSEAQFDYVCGYVTVRTQL